MNEDKLSTLNAIYSFLLDATRPDLGPVLPTRAAALLDNLKAHFYTGNPSLVNENSHESSRRGILEAAIQCVTVDRNSTHGNPEDNFKTIAAYWQAYLESIGVFKSYTDQGGARNLEPADVAALMILMKTSRLATSPERADHWVDVAGYAACGGEIATKISTKE